MNKYEKIVQKAFLNKEGIVIKRLEAVYSQSLNDINKSISYLDSSIDVLTKAYNSVTDSDIGALAATFLKNKKNLTPEQTKETLQSMIQSKVYQKDYQTALKKQVGDILDTMQDKQYKNITDYLNECYEDGFVGAMYDLHGQGIPLCFPLNQEAMVRAVQTDSKISNGLYNKLGEDVAVLKKNITSEVSRGISSGMTYAEVARQIKAKMTGIYNTPGGALYRAMTIARTEGHRIQVQSAMDACEQAKDAGADVVKQWDSTMDKRTRKSHTEVDGEIRELDEAFSNGLQYPGDPSGGPGEVVNCRCALLQRAKWALDDEELETLKQRAAYFGLDKNDSFEDFKNKYLKAVEATENKELTNSEKGGIMPTTYHDFRAIEDNHNIDADIGTKDAPICNPGYTTEKNEYTNNCGYCSATFEMRRRGCDVVAKGKNGLYVSEWEKLFVDGEAVHFKPLPLPSRKGKTAREYYELLMTLPTTHQQLSDQMLSLYENGARGSVFIKWSNKKRRGHFFSWEIENGKIRFVDGQNGNNDASEYFERADANSILFIRWDNLEPSEMIKEACTNRKGK